MTSAPGQPLRRDAPSDGPPRELPWRVLVPSTACFAISFAAWVMLGPSVRAIAAELGLSPTEASLIRSLPILVGSIVRIPVGVLADRVGARVMFPVLMLLGGLGALGASGSDTLPPLVASSAVLGLIGTTFTVGAQAVSSETPREAQGLALGIFGAGNVGTAMTTLAMPLLLAAMDWRAAFRGYAATLVVAAALYALVAPSAAPAGTSLRALAAPLSHPRTWRLGLYYTASFGVFVATTLVLTDLYIDAYATSLETAGLLATTFTVSTSLVRVVGGALADRYGARRVLCASLLTTVLALGPVAWTPPIEVAVSLLFVAGLGMGVGMSASLRYVPEHFPRSVGAVTGVVGALGGVGGFVLPNLGAISVAASGAPTAVVLPLALVAAIGLIAQGLAARSERSGPDASGSA